MIFGRRRGESIAGRFELAREKSSVLVYVSVATLLHVAPRCNSLSEFLPSLNTLRFNERHETVLYLHLYGDWGSDRTVPLPQPQRRLGARSATCVTAVTAVA